MHTNINTRKTLILIKKKKKEQKKPLYLWGKRGFPWVGELMEGERVYQKCGQRV